MLLTYAQVPALQFPYIEIKLNNLPERLLFLYGLLIFHRDDFSEIQIFSKM